MIGRKVLEQHADVLKHGLADAAGVVSHSSSGQPYPADLRLAAVPADVARAMIEHLAPIAAPLKEAA